MFFTEHQILDLLYNVQTYTLKKVLNSELKLIIFVLIMKGTFQTCNNYSLSTPPLLEFKKKKKCCKKYKKGKACKKCPLNLA